MLGHPVSTYPSRKSFMVIMVEPFWRYYKAVILKQVIEFSKEKLRQLPITMKNNPNTFSFPVGAWLRA
ncbi:hypothetical protein ADICYQ_4681 [Cyclobacterium qasimii M12-11B]|uniref:Uncharacterized protein n=1 Tax=Cyclobacterium qasimii M12-11B TaxID=641524 RepID=S7WQ95_9BACT|nr:hypothetical protein ADICYQ_4681 [Cyclobacterium qasimii M12-11B]